MRTLFRRRTRHHHLTVIKRPTGRPGGRYALPFLLRCGDCGPLESQQGSPTPPRTRQLWAYATWQEATAAGALHQGAHGIPWDPGAVTFDDLTAAPRKEVTRA